MVMPIGVPSTSIERKIVSWKPKADERGQVCQFGSFEKQMPKWNVKCKRFIREISMKCIKGSGNRNSGKAFRPQCRCEEREGVKKDRARRASDCRAALRKAHLKRLPVRGALREAGHWLQGLCWALSLAGSGLCGRSENTAAATAGGCQLPYCPENET